LTQAAPIGEPRVAVDLVAFDFDGVLTDNRVLVLEDGREAVFCNRADGLAFDWMRASPIVPLIISTERNPVVAARGRKLGVEVLQAVGDKGDALRALCGTRSIDMSRTMFVGNDVNDLPGMTAVHYPVAVADADPRVKAAAWHVLQSRGGAGVAREVAETLLGLGPAV